MDNDEEKEPSVSTIYNDPEKRKRTRANLAKDFETGTDYNEKIKTFLGMSDTPAKQEDNEAKARRGYLARRMVYGR